MATITMKARRKKGVDLRLTKDEERGIARLGPLSDAIANFAKDKRKTKRKVKKIDGRTRAAEAKREAGAAKDRGGREEDPSTLGKLRPADLILRKIGGYWHVYTRAGDPLEIFERVPAPLSKGKFIYVPTLYPERDLDEEV